MPRRDQSNAVVLVLPLTTDCQDPRLATLEYCVKCMSAGATEGDIMSKESFEVQVLPPG
jgi:hypothetical protein